MTPLHHAARKGHVAVCQLILKHIEKIHPENEFGQTQSLWKKNRQNGVS